MESIQPLRASGKRSTVREEQEELRAQIADIQQKVAYLVRQEGAQATQIATVLAAQARIEGYLTKIIQQNDNLYKALYPAGA